MLGPKPGKSLANCDELVRIMEPQPSEPPQFGVGSGREGSQCLHWFGLKARPQGPQWLISVCGHSNLTWRIAKGCQDEDD